MERIVSEQTLLSCIFTGLFTGSSILSYAEGQSAGHADVPSTLIDRSLASHGERHKFLLGGQAGEGENPYLIHQQLGDLMTRVATVVRRNDQLTDALSKVDELHERAKRVSLSDTGSWTNQNVVFAKSVQDMFPIAKCILKGALQRDECRGAHFKPEFQKQSLTAEDPVERRHQAEKWCDEFDRNNQKYLKSTVAAWDSESDQPDITYESVDTSLIKPRPRLYGLVGAEVIEEVWKERGKSDVGEKAASCCRDLMNQ